MVQTGTRPRQNPHFKTLIIVSSFYELDQRYPISVKHSSRIRHQAESVASLKYFLDAYVTTLKVPEISWML